MLERNALKDFIMHLSKRYFGNVRSREIKLGLEDSDIIQLGYIGIWKAFDKYVVGKSAFATFSRYYIQTEWQNHFSKFKSLKRTGDRDSLSTDLEINEEGSTLGEIIPSYENVEKTVLMKVHFESQLSLLTPLQKNAVLGYIEGYEMREIAEMNHARRESVERAFHRAVEKMGGERISLRHNCGRKGA